MIRHRLWPTTPARVLLVIEHPALAKSVVLALEDGRHAVRRAPLAQAAGTLAEWHPHLTIVDIDLGCDVILDQLALPMQEFDAPLIALTRHADIKTKLRAFHLGADDVVTVPFSPEELVARVMVVLRRTYRGAAPFAPAIRVGSLEIDVAHRRVRAGETELHLTSLEQSLLYLLATNAGRVLTRNEILDTLWGPDFVAESNVVDRHIRNLRTKLQDDLRWPRYIATVPGRGYRFVTAGNAPPRVHRAPHLSSSDGP